MLFEGPAALQGLPQPDHHVFTSSHTMMQCSRHNQLINYSLHQNVSYQGQAFLVSFLPPSSLDLCLFST